MQIERLRSFITLAETGSFYAASKEMYLSQQGLSKAIASLETELGAELFHRSHHGVTLTAPGQAMLGYARAIVRQHDEMLDAVLLADRQANPQTQRIRAYLTHYAMNAVRCIDRDFLFTRVRASECSFAEVLERIDRPGDADLLVCGVWPERKTELLSRSDIEFLPLLSTQMGVMMPSGAKLAGQDALHRRDVAHLPIAIAANKDYRTCCDWVFGDAPLAAIQLESDDEQLLVDFARSVPDGVALTDSFNFLLLSASGVEGVDELAFVPLSTPRAEVTIGIITKRGSSSSHLSRRSVQRLADWVTEHYPDFASRTPFAGSEA